jgi:hypothetical protein
VNLYSVRDEDAAPGGGPLIVLGDDDVGTRAEGWRERLGDAALEKVARRLPHLALNDVESLAFTLANFDREQLEQMPIIVDRRGAGAFRAVEQAIGHVEPNGPGTRRGSGRRVRGPHARSVD